MILTRLDKYVSDQDFNIIQQIAAEYIGSLGTTIWLYQIDRSNTPKTGTFEEALKNEIIFRDPIEIPALIEIKGTENSAYNEDQTLRIEEGGNIYCHILEMDYKNLSILYGDHLAYQLNDKDWLYFKIADDNHKNYENEKTWGSYRAIYKTVKGVPVDKSELTFIK